MFLPIHTDRPLRRSPVVNLTIITLNVAVFFVQSQSPAFTERLLLRPSDPSLLGFFGSAFLHANLWHLLGNMLFLYIFGNSLNDKLGHLAYAGLYAGGILASGLAHALIETAPVLGASGAVSAVTGAYLILFPRSRVAILLLFLVVTVVYVPSLYFIGLFFLLDIFQSAVGWSTGTAHMAHIGGTLYGVGVGFLLLGTNLVPRDQMDALSLIRRWKLRRDHRAGLRDAGQLHGRAHDIVPANRVDPDVARQVAQAQSLRDKINAAFERDNLREAARYYASLLRVDDRQILPMQRQLDVANQLVSDGRHADAAVAYERFLDRYSAHADHAQTQLMLGLIYGRYLGRPGDARRHLEAAAERLEEGEERDIARRELEALSDVEPVAPVAPAARI